MSVRHCFRVCAVPLRDCVLSQSSLSFVQPSTWIIYPDFEITVGDKHNSVMQGVPTNDEKFYRTRNVFFSATFPKFIFAFF